MIPRVAVIGAGISGLITARPLHDLRFDVTVFEKSRLHASPEWSAAHQDVDRDTVKATLLSAFTCITAAATLNPIHLDAHRWLFSATPLSLDRLVLFDDDTGLVVCGDWLAGGRVEGAFRSGIAAAGCILRQCGISPDKRLPT